MPAYEVQFVDAHGNKREELQFANDEAHLSQSFERRGLFLLKATERNADQSGAQRWVRKGGKHTKLKIDEVKGIFDQLDMLLSSQIPIPEGIQSLADDYPTGRTKWVLSAMSDSLRTGSSLGHACSLFPAIFPNHVITVLRVAEEKGKLSEALKNVCTYFTSASVLRSSLATAFLYPALLCGAGFGLVCFMFFYAAPKVWAAYTDLGFKMGTAEIFFKLALSANDHPVLFFGSVIAVIAGVATLWQSRRARRRLDALWLKIPVLRGLVRSSSTARFYANFAMLYGGLGEVIGALQMCVGVAGNKVYDESIQRLYEAVAEGSDLHAAMRREKLYDPIVYTSVRVGENSGKLESAMLRLAAFYANSSKQQVERALKLIEPMCLMALGVFVLFIIAFVILPFYQQSTALSGM